jgi:hypothetical protein
MAIHGLLDTVDTLSGISEFKKMISKTMTSQSLQYVHTNDCPVVVIPIHRSTLNEYERISLRRTFSVLTDHAISLLVPISRKLAIQEAVKELLPTGVETQWHVVEDEDLASHHAYNQLMLKEEFYQHYNDYSHLLICQLDVYVFEERLLEWCRQPYDYIGAPLYLPNAPHGPEGLFCIGVGGFSLRRIQPAMEMLHANPIVFRTRDFLEILKPFNYKARTLFLTRFLRCRFNDGCHLAASSNQLSKYLGVNEDSVFAKYLPRYTNSFRVADLDAALRFCIDKHVKLDLAALGGALPFAAHAWWTSTENLSAWAPFIPELRSTISVDGAEDS